MTLLEIISKQCDVINEMNDLIREQQGKLKETDIPIDCKQVLRDEAAAIEERLDILEFCMRRSVDTDDVEDSGELENYEVTVSTEYKIEVEAKGAASAMKEAKREFLEITGKEGRVVKIMGKEKGAVDD